MIGWEGNELRVLDSLMQRSGGELSTIKLIGDGRVIMNFCIS